MPGEHARLSPSAASRWLTCPASVKASEDVPDEESVAAQEGTLAHSYAELEGRYQFGQLDWPTYYEQLAALHAEADAGGWDHEEMLEHARAYVQVVRDELADPENASAQVMFEQRVYAPVDECWGTADAIIVSPRRVTILDFKYGRGVAVNAEGNPQLQIYMSAVLETYGDLLGDVEEVVGVIYQPRLSHGHSRSILSPAWLRGWIEHVVRPAAAEALDSGQARFRPTPVACRFCPIRSMCRARVEAVLGEDFAPVPEAPDELTNAEIGELLARIPEIKALCQQVEADALERAYKHSERIPGWKVVRSGGQRRITDAEAAMAALQEAGYDAEAYLTAPKLAGFGTLDKLTGGKSHLAEVLGSSLGRSLGKEALVPEDDPREPVTIADSADEDFSDLQ